jgi:hypothetical protein
MIPALWIVSIVGIAAVVLVIVVMVIVLFVPRGEAQQPCSVTSGASGITGCHTTPFIQVCFSGYVITF